MSAPGNLGETLARARALALGFRRAALTVEFYFPRIFIREQGPFAAAAAVESTFDHLQFRRQKVPRSAIRPRERKHRKEGAMAGRVNDQLATRVVH